MNYPVLSAFAAELKMVISNMAYFLILNLYRGMLLLLGGLAILGGAIALLEGFGLHSYVPDLPRMVAPNSLAEQAFWLVDVLLCVALFLGVMKLFRDTMEE